jgi:hypothetical protein
MREHVESTRQHSVGRIKAAVKDKATGRPPDDFFRHLFYRKFCKSKIAGPMPSNSHFKKNAVYLIKNVQIVRPEYGKGNEPRQCGHFLR